MKKFLTILASCGLGLTASLSTVSCAGTMIHNPTLPESEGQTDYELWSGIQPEIMQQTMNLPVPMNRQKVADLQQKYHEIDPEEVKLDAILIALNTSKVFPDFITEPFLNETFLANYFLPLVTNTLAANRYQPLATIDPRLAEPLKLLDGRKEINASNQRWILSLQNYWKYRQTTTDALPVSFREILVLEDFETVKSRYQTVTRLNTKNFNDGVLEWKLAFSALVENTNILTAPLTLEYLNEVYLTQYLNPLLTFYVWQALHPEALLIENPTPKMKLLLERYQPALMTNTFINEPNHRWLFANLRYLNLLMTTNL